MTLAALKGPYIDWAALSPVVALVGGAVLVLMAGLVRGRVARSFGVPFVTVASLGAFAGLTIWQFHRNRTIVAGALRVDDLALVVNFLLAAAGAAAVALSARQSALQQAGHGEYHALLLSSIAGMATLAEAQNLVTLFLGIELLSISLYILCATEMRREQSLESGLKYLIIGSVGSATLLYGLALVYGATSSTDFTGIARALQGNASDALLLTGIGLIVVGFAFKNSVAPFHQWTPDVYQGAPTPITAFMATATKAAAFAVFLRMFDVAFIQAQGDWGPAIAALAAVTIVVGNVGALGQSSVKRILAWSGVAQAGYMLAGVVVSTRLGVEATVFYLSVYLVMNFAAFAVVVARERETSLSDDISALAGLSADRPLLAWPMTIAMLGLAGIPATAGFIGKFNLIEAAVDGDYTWLGVFIVIGSMISLAYYLRIIAVMWMSPTPARTTAPVMAGGAGDLDIEPGVLERDPTLGGPRPAGWEVYFVAVVCGAASLVLGILPNPLFHVAKDAAQALPGLF
ncbi:MAG: NADH-quinone oxidoreductase subunit N [Solirubrobacterales bacterium]